MRQAKIRINGASYPVSRTIYTGMTSIVYKTADELVIKQYRPNRSSKQLEREVFWLDRLKGTGVAPEVVAVDHSARAILMRDGGEPISPLNAPQDWETQLAELMGRLRVSGCIHSDLTEQELLVKDGRLSVVDFAFACELESDVISSILKSASKTRYFLDEHIVDYIRFKLYGAPPGVEPHCFVLWKASEHQLVETELASRFALVRAILYTPSIFGKKQSNRTDILASFYCGRPSSHGKKGLEPFILYFVLDTKPAYENRINASRGIPSLVNVNVFDLKTRLRAGREGFLHGSDTIQECFDNLEALTIYAENVPKSYWLRWRPRFDSVLALFESLNSVETLQYVVLRNFDDLLRNKSDPHSDIDILVSDYYLFKRLTGAIGYKHKRAVRPGPAREYGGYKVSAHVSINGKEASVDIRSIGDGYYCERWERALLVRRIRCGSIFIPDNENLFYSLLYHALVHKRCVSNQYRRTLREMAPALGIHPNVTQSDKQLWDCLDQFMVRQGYTYDRPSELSIPLSSGARVRMGIKEADEFRSASDFAAQGQTLQAVDLLRGILLEKPDHFEAKRLLRRLETAYGPIANLVSLARKTRLTRLLPETLKNPIRKLVS